MENNIIVRDWVVDRSRANDLVRIYSTRCNLEGFELMVMIRAECYGMALASYIIRTSRGSNTNLKRG